MSTNMRKLKCNIRPPKKYEDSVSATSKRKENDQESSNDEISKEEVVNLDASEENSIVEEIKSNEGNKNQEKLDPVMPETTVSDDAGIKTKTYANMSVEDISALASSIGKPMVMDEMTVNMCQYRVGRTDYARVLVEIDAKMELKEVIKIKYTGKNGIVKGTKEIVVKYDWKPENCSHCNVFGHSSESRTKRQKQKKKNRIQKSQNKLMRMKSL
ncbi:zinc knuckle CX2CX4HX4C containing protein [Tanacetum coccineum]